MKHIATIALLLLTSAAFALNPTVPTPLAEKGFRYYGGTTVASVAVGTAGTGYTSLPTVAFTGGSGGVQATGTSTLKAVGSVTVSAGGTGYAVNDVLSITGGTKSTTATFTVSTVSSGVVTAVTITNAGVYTVLPSFPVATTVAPSGGTGCTLTIGWGVGTVVVVTGGNDYLTAPSVAFSGGAGSSAAATATLASVPAIAQQIRAIIPITATVISAITFPTSIGSAGDGDGSYSGDLGIIGKTLAVGVEYKIYANSFAVSSGNGIAILRAKALEE